MNRPASPIVSESEIESRSRQLEALNLISHPIWVFDIDASRVYWANEAAQGVWNSKHLIDLCNRDMGSDMSEAVCKRLAQYQNDFWANNSVFNEQWTLYPDGKPVSLYVRFSGYRLDDGRMAMLCHGKPALSETPESLRSVEALLHTPVMITLYDMSGIPLYRNPASRASAVTTNQSLDSRLAEPDAYPRLLSTLDGTQLTNFTLLVRTASGEQWHELSARRCKDAVTGHDAILVSEVDVSALKRTEAKANFLSLHDGLTGLPNRAHVIQRFTKVLDEVSRHNFEAALIFIDLDHFKDVNDTLGHVAGDELLVQVAERLKRATRSTDFIARLGGDEFLILMISQDIVYEVDHLRARVLQNVIEPINVRGTELRVTPTMGVSLFPRDGSDFETLLRKADLAMYSAKQSGRNHLVYYTEDLGNAVSARTALVQELHHAFDRNQFEVYYQPIVCTTTWRIAEVEALVRWRHPQRGLVPPDAFISACESTGMILHLGRFVFEQAVRQQVEWSKLGYPVKVNVNLSPRQFSDPDLVKYVRDMLTSMRCDSRFVGFEVTESLLLGKTDRSTAVLRSIAALGISIAVDDFGTGYSNLAYLQRYPISTLKIDKSFIQSKHDDRPLADLIVSLCRTLGMSVVAEGVETQEQLDWVLARQIEHYQGYLFSKPVPAAEMQILLESTANFKTDSAADLQRQKILF